MKLNVELKRNNYYTGKRIDEEDLTLEQEYFIDKIKTVNKMLLGYGIVSGLSIAEFKNSQLKFTIKINPGVGIDNHGNFITLLDQKAFKLSKNIKDKDYIYLKYNQSYENIKPLGDANSCDDDCIANHIVDNVQIFVSKDYLVPTVRNVCSDTQSPRNDEEFKEPLLLLGKFLKIKDKTIIDTSVRKYIHTNTEIFKLLCKINQSYVSSVNGLSGDLNLISTIGESKPNEDGEIDLIAGNNISINYDENQIRIDTKAGFYQDYHITLNSSRESSQDINHYQNRFPLVDIYEREVDGKNQDVFLETELKMRARDLNIEFDTYKSLNNIEAIKDKFSGINNKKITVRDALNKNNVLGNASSKVLKHSEKKFHYYADSLYVAPKYTYKKTATLPNIEVVHLNNKTVRIINKSGKKINLLVILST